MKLIFEAIFIGDFEFKKMPKKIKNFRPKINIVLLIFRILIKDKIWIFGTKIQLIDTFKNEIFKNFFQFWRQSSNTPKFKVKSKIEFSNKNLAFLTVCPEYYMKTFHNHKNHEEELAGERAVGGIWGVLLGGTGPRLGPVGGRAEGGGGEGEGTPATIAAPGGVVKLCTRP